MLIIMLLLCFGAIEDALSWDYRIDSLCFTPQPYPYLQFELDSTLIPEWVKQPDYDQESRHLIEEMTREQDVFARIVNFFVLVNVVNHSLTDSLLREIKATLYDAEGNAIAGYKYTKEK